MRTPVRPEPAILRTAKRLSRSAVAKGLLQFAEPTAKAWAVALETLIAKQEKRRKRAFFDELGRSGLNLTPELARSDDFIYCYEATARAAIKARRLSKTRLFARLLCSATSNQAVSDTDTYEEYVAILDDLSYRELEILSILERHEKANPARSEQNPVQRTAEYWPQIQDEIARRLRIHIEDVEPLLNRLARTGLYIPITGAYLDYAGGRGQLTSLYYQLAKLIQRWDDAASRKRRSATGRTKPDGSEPRSQEATRPTGRRP